MSAYYKYLFHIAPFLWVFINIALRRNLDNLASFIDIQDEVTMRIAYQYITVLLRKFLYCLGQDTLVFFIKELCRVAFKIRIFRNRMIRWIDVDKITSFGVLS